MAHATRLGAYSLGFLRDRRLRAALAAAGYSVHPGPFAADVDAIAVWGARPVAARGRRAAARRGLPLLHIEDSPILSAASTGSEPLVGLTIDRQRPAFDGSGPSDLEDLINAGTAACNAEALERFRRHKLSKYNDGRALADDGPAPGFVLVADQVRGDASIAGGGADARTFQVALTAALDENPGCQVVIKTHPRGRGHFSADALPDRACLLADNVIPADLFARASRVYCVTSQIGFEAILHGHRPRVFGMPFYAGWGLSDDACDVPRRVARPSAARLFDAVVGAYPVWIDPARGCRITLHDAMSEVAARRRTRALAARCAVVAGARRWKRPLIRRALGPVAFADASGPAVAAAGAAGGACVAWASRMPPDLPARCTQAAVPLVRMEDGFLRSRGLGAALTPAASLALDDLGIYYDPSSESRLERLIAASADLPPAALARAARLRAAIVAAGLSKYNVGAAPGIAPARRPVVLVPGQVADDASVRLGTGDIGDNRALLVAARAAYPDACLLYKPHPDVEAGLRAGAIDVGPLCDGVLAGVDAAAAIELADRVCTMTSLLGFEALLRGVPVTCFGQPFYAGWGLTEDRGGAPARRRGPVPLDGLVHAALIGYPIYLDTATGGGISAEALVRRLAAAPPPQSRALARAQRVWKRFSR